jgi:hypothetical protein
MKSFLKLAFLIGLIATLTSGCAVNRASGSISPKTDLTAVKSVYLKQEPKDDNTYQLIADKLRSKGVAVTVGNEAYPKNVDAVVTYVDKWMWDITMYMIELTVIIRDPNNGFPMAKGNSYHTSLTRLSPKEMVDEVIDNIYNNKDKEAKK